MNVDFELGTHLELSDGSEFVGDSSSRSGRRRGVVDDLSLPRELVIPSCLLRESGVNGEESFDRVLVSSERLRVDGSAVLTEVVDSREGFAAVTDEGFLASVLPVERTEGREGETRERKKGERGRRDQPPFFGSRTSVCASRFNVRKPSPSFLR